MKLGMALVKLLNMAVVAPKRQITDPITDLRKQSVALLGEIVRSKTEKHDTQ